MRTRTQILLLAVLAAGSAAWHFYGERAGLPRPLALVGLEAPAAGGPSGRPSGAGGPPVGVIVAPARTATVVERAEAVGTVRAREAVTITAKVTGIVTAIRFEEGGKVAAGEPLVLLDDAALRAEMDQARAVLDDARGQLQRAQRLVAGQVIAEQRVETLQSTARQAEGRVRQAQARLEEMRITAPFAGRVGLRQVSPGALIQPGTVVTTLDDLSQVRVEFSAPEVYLARIRTGSRVAARGAAFGDRLFEGRVAVVDTRIDPATRSVRAIAEFDNPDEALRPGLFLNVALDLDVRENAVLIPEEAVDPVGDRAFVYAVRGERVRRVEVGLGLRLPGEVEVRRGLQPGETVVVQGLQRLRNDAPVRVVETRARPTS